MANKKILVFTDSRGQHKPGGSNHKIFGERLRDEVPGVEVELVLCPMKWTTIIDFLDYAENHDVNQYDWIVLFLGIVDWSPRPASGAYDLVYNNLNTVNTERLAKDTRDYSQKTVNNKKRWFDRLFGEQAIIDYLTHPTDVEYMGEPTINMYALDMAERALLPHLLAYKNMIFISANRFLSDWDGDYKKGRPANIGMTHAYSDLFSEAWPKDRLVDLRVWGDNDVKKYTCDNLHLTKAGSDFIFDKLVEIMSLSPQQTTASQMQLFEKQMEKDLAKLIRFEAIERFDVEKKKALLASVGNRKNLGTLIVGMRITGDNDDRLGNLSFLLDWIDFHYGDLFDVLLVEQDAEQRFLPEKYHLKSYVRYEFIYNPEDYNRGWGYNVAVRHFCHDSSVVALMDIDILTGRNFVSEMRDCLIGKYDVISPYQNVYDTDAAEANGVKETMSFDGLKDTGKIKRSTSITGGIVIVSRKTYMALHGFEQYMGYSCEDRAFDVTIMNLCDPAKVRISPCAYVHLYHPVDTAARKNFKEIYGHLTQNYGCVYDPNVPPTGFIHAGCQHVDKAQTLALANERGRSFGDKDLYLKGGNISINGIAQAAAASGSGGTQKIVLPEEFRGLDGYEERELYKAPAPDSNELAKLYNAFLGERCFILGNGPSLNKHDLSFLANEYSFGVNGIFYKTDECGYAPYFYVVEDSSVMKENIERIKAYGDPTYKFFPTNYSSLHPKTPNTFFFRMNRGFYEKSSPNYAVPRFSTDATKQLFCGQSVTHINLQLAYFMGFAEVYLIGMDFSYVIPPSHKRSGDVLLSDTDDDNHFNPNYFGKGKTWKDPKLDRVENNYRLSKLVYESTGRKIYNASIGGKLEVFERVDYEQLFAKGRKTTPVVIVPAAVAGPATVRASSPAVGAPTPAAPGKPQPAAARPAAAAASVPEAPAAPQPTKQQSPAKGNTGLPLYTRTALHMQANYPTLFRVGQFGMWLLRSLKRGSLPALLTVGFLVLLLVTPLLVIELAPYGHWFRGSAIALAALTILLAAGYYIVQELIGLIQREHLARQGLRGDLGREVRKQTDQTIAALRARNEEEAKARQSMAAHISRLEQELKVVSERQQDGARATTDEAKARQILAAHISRLDRELKVVSQRQQDGRRDTTEAEIKLGRRLDQVQYSAPVFNYADFQSFNRRLTENHIGTLTGEWAGKLGLALSPKGLSYLAHRICMLEGTMRGRLATTIEDAVLRVLVTTAVKQQNLRVLEIGTLFGIGLAMIYELTSNRFENVHLTAIDRLEGYYGKDARDIATDETIDEANLRYNLTKAGVPDADFTLIKALSTDKKAINAARRGGKYDVLIIDGDHSYAGVKADFVEYLPFVAHGGYIIFDDYTAPNWPGVQQFVDEHVRKCEDVAFVGASWRTAVFRVMAKAQLDGGTGDTQ